MDKKRLERLLDNLIPLEYREEVSSTNDVAKERALQGRTPTLVVAGRQTAGRGRYGNHFASPPGGLYMSLAIDEPHQYSELVTSYVAVCVSESLEETHGVLAGIKWVNDVYVQGRKIAGILVERTNGSIVVGIGINGNGTPKLSNNVQAISLAECADSIDLELLCATITRHLVEGLTNGIDLDRTINYCREHSVLLGRKISFELEGRAHCGTAIDLAKDGSLLVEEDGELLRLFSIANNVRIFNPSIPKELL